MEQCTHCGAWGNEDICPYCDCEMPGVKRKRAEKEKAAAAAAATRRERAESEDYTAPEPASGSFVPFSNRRTITLILCIFGGFFGLHYFYNRRIGKGVLYLFTVGLFYIGWFVDIVLILLGKFKDKNGDYIL